MRVLFEQNCEVFCMYRIQKYTARRNNCDTLFIDRYTEWGKILEPPNIVCKNTFMEPKVKGLL